ncbi:MAG TPA: hypothetical protein VKE94_16075 [Gemmataceae bacterium]|nr:hypothetical protein [Gemmataceae bacterium]
MRIALRFVLALAFALPLGCKQRADTQEPPQKGSIEGGLRKNIPTFNRAILTKHLTDIAVGFTTSPELAPNTIEELEQVHGSRQITQAIKEGAIVVILGVRPSRQPGDAILAYQAQPDASGERVVLTCSGSVQVMDAKSFETAPKAQAK